MCPGIVSAAVKAGLNWLKASCGWAKVHRYLSASAEGGLKAKIDNENTNALYGVEKDISLSRRHTTLHVYGTSSTSFCKDCSPLPLAQLDPRHQ